MKRDLKEVSFKRLMEELEETSFIVIAADQLNVRITKGWLAN